MKKMLIGFIFLPLIYSTVSYAHRDTTLEQRHQVIPVSKSFHKTSGERALEERPFNPKPLKCNDPVSGSDGSEPDVVVDLDR